MKVIRSFESDAVPLQPEWFTGEGTRRDVTRIDSPDAGITVVSFEPGGRTNWHSHSHGQVLFVLTGSGKTATRAEPAAEIGAGDVVYAAPGEQHWHGAANGEPMSHVALSFGQTDWLEPVEE
jgi:quercetin dioxygenase-like cupin family protein